MRIPSNLAALGRLPGGSTWLDALPTVVGEVAARWGLELGTPFATAQVSWTAPARRSGEDLVVKVQFPHRECTHEADALRHWDGRAAVRLVDHDPSHHALLLERCRPGTPLADTPGVDAVGVVIDLLPELWRPAGPPFAEAAVEATGWAAGLERGWLDAGRPCERRLVDAALDALAALPGTQGPRVLVHQDLHGGNVLAAARQPWLVIDPKPLAGERELGIAPLVRSFEFGHSASAVRGRLDRLCGELGLDRERARGWTVAQTMAWSFDSAFVDRHHQTVRWLLDG